MSYWRSTVFALLCAGASVAQSAPPAQSPEPISLRQSQFADPDPLSIDRAIDGLSASNWRERRQAVKQLVKIGPAAQRRLESLIESPVAPETRLRDEAALTQIIPQRRIEPALITREFVNANIADTFDRVAEIEGASLRCEPPDLIRNIKHPITVRYDHELYWNVMLDLCRRSGLRLRCDERGVTIIRAGPKAKFDRFDVNGVLLITVPQSINGHPDSPHLAVIAEPRARLLHGRGLQLKDGSTSPGENLTNGFWWPIQHGSSTPATSVSGMVDVLLAESQPTLEAPGASSRRTLGGPVPLDLSAGGVSVSVMRVIHSQANYDIDLQLSIDPAEVNWDALLFSMRTGGLRIYDVDERELAFINLSCNGVGPVNNVRVVMSPQPSAQIPATQRPYKLVWDLPAKTVAKKFAFELTDLPPR